MRIRIDKENFGRASHCLTDVMVATRKNGGSPVFGWTKDGTGLITALLGHVCWRKPDSEIVCITPSSSNDNQEEIDFFPDDTVRQEWQRTGFQPFKISTPHPTLTAFIRRSEEAYIRGRHAKGDYWTARANEIAVRYGAHLRKRPAPDGHLKSIAPLAPMPIRRA